MSPSDAQAAYDSLMDGLVAATPPELMTPAAREWFDRVRKLRWVASWWDSSTGGPGSPAGGAWSGPTPPPLPPLPPPPHGPAGPAAGSMHVDPITGVLVDPPITVNPGGGDPTGETDAPTDGPPDILVPVDLVPLEPPGEPDSPEAPNDTATPTTVNPTDGTDQGTDAIVASMAAVTSSRTLSFAPPGGSSLVLASFGAGALAASWTAYAGQWSQAAGVLQCDGLTAGKALLCCQAVSGTGEHTVSITRPTGGVVGQVGPAICLAEAAGTVNGYAAIYDGANVTAYRIDAGAWTSLGSAAFGAWADAAAFKITRKTGPTYVQDTGFTTLTPSGDSRLIYVSSSGGNDANDGLSAATPKLTITGASGGLSLMRSGFPDWLQLKCGDTFNEAAGIRWKIAGRGINERAVFTSYGTGARPIVQSTDAATLQKFNGGGTPNPLDHVAVVGIDLVVTGRTAGTTPECVKWLDNTTNLLFEDCAVHGGHAGFNLVGSSGTLTNVALRRNIVYRIYSRTGHASAGYFDKIAGLELTENFCDYGGWDPDTPTANPDDIFQHAFYVQSNCTGTQTFQRNVIMRPSSHGLQARAGGTIQDNVFIECPIACLAGGGDSPVAGGVNITVSANVIHGDRKIAGSGRGYGIDVKNILGGTVTGNFIVNKTTTDAAFAIGSYVSGGPVGVGVTNLTVQGNRVHNWRGGMQFGTGGQTYTAVLIDGNTLESRLGDTPALQNDPAGTYTGRTWSNNAYFNTAGGNCFNNGSAVSFATWSASAGEAGSTFTAAASALAAPPDIKAVVQALAGSAIASLDDLSALYIGRGRAKWNPAVAADKIVDWYQGSPAVATLEIYNGAALALTVGDDTYAQGYGGVAATATGRAAAGWSKV